MNWGETPRWLKISGLFLDLLLIFWIPFEDRSEQFPILLAALLSAWVSLRFLVSPMAARRKTGLTIVVAILAGLLLSPLALVFMALKSGFHGHGAPDFTPQQMQAVLARLPYFAISGLLLGLGAALFLRTRPHASAEPQPPLGPSG